MKFNYSYLVQILSSASKREVCVAFYKLGTMHLKDPKCNLYIKDIKNKIRRKMLKDFLLYSLQCSSDSGYTKQYFKDKNDTFEVRLVRYWYKYGMKVDVIIECIIINICKLILDEFQYLDRNLRACINS